MTLLAVQNPLQVATSPTGLALRNGFNAAIQSLAAFNAGPTDPATTSPSTAYPYMLWPDTTNMLLKQRKGDNSVWVAIGTINADGTFKLYSTSVDLNNVSLTGLVTTAGQIAFPAIQNPSAGANVLDDYEEGTWTPQITGGTTAGAATYTTQVGRYTKIGRLVMLSFFVNWSSHTGTGQIQLAGLPFASANTSIDGCSSNLYTRNIPVGSYLQLVANTSTALMVQNTATVPSAVNLTGTLQYFEGQINYEV